MHELLCGPADFMSLKAREDYSTPEPLTRRPCRRLPWPTRVDSSWNSRQHRRGETTSRILSPVFKHDGAKRARCLSFRTARLSVRVKNE